MKNLAIGLTLLVLLAALGCGRTSRYHIPEGYSVILEIDLDARQVVERDVVSSDPFTIYVYTDLPARPEYQPKRGKLDEWKPPILVEHRSQFASIGTSGGSGGVIFFPVGNSIPFRITNSANESAKVVVMGKK